MAFRRMPVASLRARLSLVFSALGLSDLIGFIGFLSLLYGLAQWSRPAAYVTAGILLMSLSVALWLREARR